VIKSIAKSIQITSWTSHHAYSSRVVDAWLVGVIVAISRSGHILM
jgi:hypothetical protein